jgi:hypothetical protein
MPIISEKDYDKLIEAHGGFLDENYLDLFRGEQKMTAYRETDKPTIDDMKVEIHELEAENSGLERTIVSYKTSEKRLARWKDQAIAFGAVVGVMLGLSIGGAFVYDKVRETYNEKATLALAHSESEIARETVIANRFALDRKHKAAAEKKYDAGVAKISKANGVYIDSTYNAAKEWARAHQVKGIYSCDLKRNQKTPINQGQWHTCKIFRDYEPDIKLLCSPKTCGGAIKGK